MIQGLDRRLIEDSGTNARQVLVPGSYVPQFQPLVGIKVEDTYNLLGHALRKAISVIARQQGRAGGGSR